MMFCGEGGKLPDEGTFLSLIVSNASRIYPQSVRPMIARAWERFGPSIIGLVIFVLAYRYEKALLDAASQNKWHLDALYASVFNIAAASSAFLFAFYTYVRTSEGAILREIRASAFFRRASKYMIRSILVTSILALASVPFLIVVPEPHDNHHAWYWAICIWTAFSGYTFATIVRSAYHFIAIMEAAYGDRLAA